MAKATRKSKPPRLKKALPRRIIDQMIRDLLVRLGDLEKEADSIAVMIQPNGLHTVIEHQTRTACCVMLEGLQSRIHNVKGLTRILVDRSEVAA